MRFSIKLAALFLIVAGAVAGVASTVSGPTATSATTFSTDGLIWE
ncbi:hypothetical protein [Actinoplanes sp. L3-i22]|nr:hypothetical protein [Actinoplanes sp. L3-i22]